MEVYVNVTGSSHQSILSETCGNLLKGKMRTPVKGYFTVDVMNSFKNSQHITEVKCALAASSVELSF